MSWSRRFLGLLGQVREDGDLFVGGDPFLVFPFCRRHNPGFRFFEDGWDPSSSLVREPPFPPFSEPFLTVPLPPGAPFYQQESRNPFRSLLSTDPLKNPGQTPPLPAELLTPFGLRTGHCSKRPVAGPLCFFILNLFEQGSSDP